MEIERKQFLLNKEQKMYLNKLKIGNVELNNNILLAPMAGITDLPFRFTCEKFEPRLSCNRNGKFKSSSIQ